MKTAILLAYLAHRIWERRHNTARYYSWEKFFEPYR